MLPQEIRRPDWDGTRVPTRVAVIQRVFSHDIGHCAELNEQLKIAGANEIDFRD
jgi:hypothetical protein